MGAVCILGGGEGSREGCQRKDTRLGGTGEPWQVAEEGMPRVIARGNGQHCALCEQIYSVLI